MIRSISADWAIVPEIVPASASVSLASARMHLGVATFSQLKYNRSESQVY